MWEGGQIVQNDKYFHKSLRPEDNDIDNNAIWVIQRTKKRASANDLFVKLHRNSSTKTVVHEMGHTVHRTHSKVEGFIKNFFRRRTKGLKPTKIYVDEKEMGVEDDFFSHYVGRIYGREKSDPKGSEVFSMGVQEMFDNPEKFYNRDKEHFSVTLAVMEGLLW